MTVPIRMNGRELQAQEGITVFEAARANGIEIPTLCHHPNLKPVGSCRLCLVDVEGRGYSIPLRPSPLGRGESETCVGPRIGGLLQGETEVIGATGAGCDRRDLPELHCRQNLFARSI